MKHAEETTSLKRVERAFKELRRGKMVILTDDEDRENEGDLVLAAEKATPKDINFMATFARGLICLTLTESQVKRLNLPPMVHDNSSPRQTAFTVSIEASHGVSTGISAYDRALTVKAAINLKALPADVSRPGHVFPLKARDGGVLVRPGHTEASVDLARLAGLNPSAVICEVMRDDGHMARRPDLERFAKKHKLMILAIDDVIAYRLSKEKLIRRVATSKLARQSFGDFKTYAYTSDVDSAVHVALVKGDVAGDKPVLTRMHRATVLGDLMDACAGGGTLKESVDAIVREGRGVIVMLQRPQSGDEALATEPPLNVEPVSGTNQSRLREFGVGAQILNDLGVKKLRLLTNTPKRIVGVERYGIEVVEQLKPHALRPDSAVRLRSFELAKPDSALKHSPKALLRTVK
jgi:3,4-dihydroxy 2-butanone 4-phosphate synthase / GTP cyclohydrolase II